ncbi:SpaA isopeptide-forming pilin-related protein [Ohessyouella blattaphilus]|uniref:SpaA isopeptide-forming pilin-related protein n=1 Tax=Ohessyouella blattaphilus TaxID=2949333 RepID=A0ABT1EI39_9FIRM|nr:SpaA isopeptide-forming pilin-related protein [Ohessyouella blattaphilus]MCP1109351.1 SpaA isopeptide-forming pilin-related protein [Ohessyouella blattaphilus]MCR8562745.1 SpaA isopeptide-forming pilin-related protein [Ohessyouella blattaphilus]
MKKAKRVVALLLAVLVFCTSDSYLYQVLAEEAPIEETTPTDTEGNGGTTDGSTNQTGDTQGGNEDGGSENNAGSEAAGGGESLDGSSNTTVPEGTESNTSDQLGTAAIQTLEGGVSQNANAFATLEGKLNKTQDEITIQSGDSFDYDLKYVLNAQGSDDTNLYNALSLTVVLPKGFEVAKDENGNFILSGAGITGSNLIYNTSLKKYTLVINFERGIETGAEKSLTVKLKTKNFEIAHLSEFEMDAYFDVTLGSDNHLKVDVDKKAKVTVEADDGWEIDKRHDGGENVQNTDAYRKIDTDTDEYVYTYYIDLTSTKPDGDADAYGRMNFKKENGEDLFKIIDTLPVAGIKAGAGAKSVKITIGNGEIDLVEGKDYKVAKDAHGDITSFEITRVNKASADGEYIPKGAALPTKYTVEVRYPHAPYKFEYGTQEPWTIVNNATLDYTLIDGERKEKDDHAEFLIGEPKNKLDAIQIPIVKYLSLGKGENGSEEIVLDKTTRGKYGIGSIKFKITDTQGNPIRNNEGSLLDGNSAIFTVGDNGNLSIPKIKDESADYLLTEIVEDGETGIVKPPTSGFVVRYDATTKKFSIVNANNYKVSLVEVDTKIKVVNTLAKNGAVEFYKYGKDLSGNYNPLDNVSFLFVLKDSEDGGVTVNPGSDGKVRLDGLASGEYYIYETSSGYYQYDAPNPLLPIGSVEVVDGKLCAPIFSPAQDAPPAGINYKSPFYINYTNQGSFKIKKVVQNYKDGKVDGKTLLEDPATFEVYGTTNKAPFSEAPTVAGLDGPADGWVRIETLVTEGGEATSSALKEGYYVILETESPKNYNIVGNGMTVVQVEKSKAAKEYEIINYSNQRFDIIKYGTYNGNTIKDGNILKGATFDIYRDAIYSDNPDDIDIIDGKVKVISDLITEADGSNLAITEQKELAPGTYYYKETKAPDGFKAKDDSYKEFVVEPGKNARVVVYNVAESNFGRIIIKKKSAHDEQPMDDVSFEIYSDKECTQLKDTLISGTALNGANEIIPGKAQSKLLPYETYYIKEVKGEKNADYIVSSEPIAVTLDAENKEVTREWLNVRGIELQIEKVDSKNANIKLSNAKFNLYLSKDDGTEELAYENISDEEGIYSFGGLIPGAEYKLYEASAPEGYKPVKEYSNYVEGKGLLVGTYTIPALGGENYQGGFVYKPEAAITNDRLADLVVLKKTNSPEINGGSVALQGVEFKLYEDETLSKEVATTNGTTNAEGKATWENLIPGKTYYLKETQTVDGHELDSRVHTIVLNPGDNKTGYATKLTEIFNNADKGILGISKVSEALNGEKSPLDNIQFKIIDTDANPNKYVTDSNGNALTIKNGQKLFLKAGNYKLEEVQNDASAGYTLKEGTDLTFEIETGKICNKFTEKPIVNIAKGQLFVDKKGVFTDTKGEEVLIPISGATIEIYNATEGFQKQEEDLKKAPLKVTPDGKSTVTMSSSSWESILLPEGEYWVKEVYAPEGYEVGANAIYKIRVTRGQVESQDASENGSTNKIVIKNTPKDYTTIRLKKLGPDGEAITNVEAGAKFKGYLEVKKDSDEYKAATEAGTVEEYTDADGTHYLVPCAIATSGDANGLLQTSTEDGTVLTIPLEVNKDGKLIYWFKEIEPPRPGNYIISNEWSKVEITADDIGKIVDKSITNDKKNTVGGEKTASNSKGQSGVYLALFEDPIEAKAVKGYLKTGGFQNTNDFEDRRKALKSALGSALEGSTDNSIKNPFENKAYNGIQLDLADEGFNKIKQIAITDVNGKYTFSNLEAGKTYYIVELLPAEGFAYKFDNDGVDSTWTVKYENGEYSTAAESIYNYVLEELQVKKTTKVGDYEIPVEGVLFFVYPAKEEPKDSGKYVQASNDKVAYGFTKADGVYTSIPLEIGHYIVVEADAEDYGSDYAAENSPYLKPPASIEIGNKDGSKQVPVEVDGEGEINSLDGATIQNTAKYGYFALQKRINGSSSKEQNVTFKLVKKGEPGNSDSVIEIPALKINANTSESEIWISQLLPTGTYTITEESMAGYTIKDSNGEKKSITFEIKAGCITGYDAEKGGFIFYGDGIIYNNKKEEIGEFEPEDAKIPLTFENDKQGSLELTKKGIRVADDGTVTEEKPLEDVEFGLYKRTGENSKTDIDGKDPSYTGKTSSTGVLTINDIDAGDYWLVELNYGSDSDKAEYEMMNPIEIRIEIGQKLTQVKGSNVLVNESTYGRFKFKKIDQNSGTGLKDVGFGIYTKSGETYTEVTPNKLYTSGSDGTVISEPLPAGTYYVKEVSAKQDYLGNKNTYFKFEVMAKTLTDYSSVVDKQIKNERVFALKFKKGDSQDKALDGAKFVMSTDKSEVDKADKDSVASDKLMIAESKDGGQVTFSGLTIGGTNTSATKTFYVKEVVAPKTSKDGKVTEEYILSNKVHTITVGYKDIASTGVYVYEPKINEKTITVRNDRKGKFTFKKVGSWLEEGVSGVKPLEDAEFSFYKVDAIGDAIKEDAKSVDTVKTNKKGVGTTIPLEAGVYAFKETKAPEGFELLETTFWVVIDNNEVKNDYYTSKDSKTTDNINNDAQDGDFFLMKYDGKKGDEISSLHPLDDSVFRLEKYIGELASGEEPEADDAKWEPVNKVNPYIRPTAKSGYPSGYLTPGWYRVIEDEVASKPKYTDDNGVDSPVTFSIDTTPIQFQIFAGQTTNVYAYNSPKVTVQLTKYGDTNNNGEIDKDIDVKLSGGKFKLTYDVEGNHTVKGASKDLAIANGGVVTWNAIDAFADNEHAEWVNPDNKYDGLKVYVHEVSVGTNNQNYDINEKPTAIIIVPGKKVTDNLIFTGEMLDASNKGVINIVKTDGEGNYLAGAKFTISEKLADNTYKQRDEVVSTGDSAGVTSKALPAAKEGTTYKITEVEAPKSYMLDANYTVLEQEVTLYPNQAVPVSVEFTNKKVPENKADNFAGTKGIKLPESSNYSERVVLGESLITKADGQNLGFKISGFAKGDNVYPAETLAVEDKGIKLYSAKDGGNRDKEISLTRAEDVTSVKDYKINSITVHAATNSAEANPLAKNLTVSAKLYIMDSFDNLDHGTYVEVKDEAIVSQLADLSNDQIIDFNAAGLNVYGFKVVYENVLKSFKTDGIEFNATFANRSNWPLLGDNKPLPEVRFIYNQASIIWRECIKGSDGKNIIKEDTTKNTNQVWAEVPTYQKDFPKVTLTNEIRNPKTTGYAPGEDVTYLLTATNVEKENGPNFTSPIISFRMPGDTTLREEYSDGQPYIILLTRNGQDPEPVTAFEVSYVTEYNGDKIYPFISRGMDGLNEDTTRSTTQYSLTFEGLVLEPGDQLSIQFVGEISEDKKTGVTGKTDLVKLFEPAYLSSAYKVEKTAENPNGMSFKKGYDHDVLITSGKERDIVDAASNQSGMEYIRAIVETSLLDHSDVRIHKEISTDNSNWLGRGITAEVNSGGSIYYRLTVMNYSSNVQKTARILDVLPFAGDTMGVSGKPRDTDIPVPTADRDNLTVVKVHDEGQKAKEYYYVEENLGDNSFVGNTKDVNPDLYAPLLVVDTMTAWSNWKPTLPTGDELRKVSAVGLDIDFGEAGLKPGESYSVVLEMKAPSFSTAQSEEFVGKYMNNAVMANKLMAGDESFSSKAVLERNPVKARMVLPKGELGDRVWYDSNNDGIQDADEKGIIGATVDLYKTTYYKLEGSDKVLSMTSKVDSMKTDDEGKYLFKELDCNYLKASGDSVDTEDPYNYVGNKYYEYHIQVTLPENDLRVPTLKNIGDDTKDSDIERIDPDTKRDISDRVRLEIKNENGELVPEKNYDLDAGYIDSYTIGNYVWEDGNYDGYQNENEKGVSGVSVKLYQVDGKDGKIADNQMPIKTTVTSTDGKYQFEGLNKGYYVVEFDVSALTYKDEEGNRWHSYTFTDSPAEQEWPHEYDNDAINELSGSNGKVSRTNVIEISNEALEEAKIDDRRDMRWDAGLVKYSALGGLAFEDLDYDHLHIDDYLALEGIDVYLYDVTSEAGEGKLVDQTKTNSEGRYLFENLKIKADEYRDYKIKFVFPDDLSIVEGNQDASEVVNSGSTSYAVDAKLDTDSKVDSDVNTYMPKDGSDNGLNQVGYINRVRLYQGMRSITWDAGANKRSAIGDRVWLDDNRDGLQGPTEKGLQGIRVELQYKDKPSETWEFKARTYTDANGKYLFKNLESSDAIERVYRVVFVLDESDRQVTLCNVRDSLTEIDSDGNEVVIVEANAETDSDALLFYHADIVNPDLSDPTYPNCTGGYVTSAIKPGYGETDLTWDAGVIPVLASLGDYMWHDIDYDGIQDSDEEPVAGARIALERNDLNARTVSGWKEVASTYTDDTGYYAFHLINPGNYRVRFYIPDGYTATKYNRGEGDNDSHASRRADGNSYYSRQVYLKEATFDQTLDAGIYNPKERVVRRTVRNYRRRVRSGDNSSLMLWSLLLMGSIGVISIGGISKKRKKKIKKAKMTS